eukprot:gene351-228_t
MKTLKISSHYLQRTTEKASEVRIIAQEDFPPLRTFQSGGLHVALESAWGCQSFGSEVNIFR